MIYTVKAIMPPYVFVEDSDGNTQSAMFEDFASSPSKNTSVKDEDGSFIKVSSSVDPDCVGGVCPIK